MRSRLTTLRLYFNSQPHKEADEPLFNRRGYSAYFNSQPHKEADRCALVGESSRKEFQLTASQGG